MSELGDNTIRFILVMLVWFFLLAGYAAYEKWKEKRKRNRFLWQVKRWSL